MIDLEDNRARHRRKSVCPRIKPRAQYHDLIDTGVQSRHGGIVDKAGTRHGRGTRTRPAAIDESTDESARERDLRERDDKTQMAAEERRRVSILEQTGTRRDSRFERSEQRHVPGGATGLSFPHQVFDCVWPSVIGNT